MYMEAKARPLFIVAEVRRHPIAANQEPLEAGNVLPEGGTIDTKVSEGFRVAG
jgi:dolichol-phosphate mannosyltransferase